MELKAKVLEIGITQQVSEKLTKRELIVEYVENPQYPEYLKFEMINDKCFVVDNIKVGDDVEVHFNLRGRPWTDKRGVKTYFNSLQLWKISAMSGSNVPQYAPPVDISSKPDVDELPF